jgi:hypothetical protein
MCRALQKKKVEPARNNKENIAATLPEILPLWTADSPNTRHNPTRTTTKPVSESTRLIQGTGAAGNPTNGNPLLNNPSTVSNNPTQGASARFISVASIIATQSTILTEGRQALRPAFGGSQIGENRAQLRAYEVRPGDKLDVLRHLLYAETGQTLVFTRTKRGTERLTRELVRDGDWVPARISIRSIQRVMQLRRRGA